MLQQHFGDRVISHNFGVLWPPRFPGLTPMDFWFLGYLKSKVYTSNSLDLSELKDAIKREVIQTAPCYVRHCWKKSPACNALSSAKVGTLKTWNSNKKFFFPLLSCVVIGPLQCSSLKMSYVGNFRHECINPIPFMVFECIDQLWHGKSGVAIRKFRNFFAVSVTLSALLF
ncbi:hypothetical protein AVEN_246541-1 [Araneus ventricosus]|uniref:Uncharacterized protein n=1 Tax=Araneus ventricosus TaxID=182803 RepID=A0A4Y2TC64_ARAVE|nr:hypothetical protein AVEN_246541-1 [Araneus ventricosus]